VTQETPRKPTRWLTLSRQIVIGLTAGIACGLFFGEICGALQGAGKAFVALMQMTVLPYIVLALIVNIGSLTIDTARHLVVRAAIVLLALWGIAIAMILLLPMALPVWPSGGFFSTSLVQTPESVDFLSLYIPANPFRSLAENFVPAVVLFCISLGIALIGITQKERVIEPMQVMLDAMTKITLFVAKLTPFGIFAIAASAAGTITLGQIERLQGYMIIYISAAILITFVALPLAVAAVTPFSYREIVGSSRSALLTAFAANNYFIVLPMLIESLKELYRAHDLGGDDTDQAIDITLPIGFPFPNIGRLLAMIFIPFGAWFVGQPLPIIDYPMLVLAGLPSFFAKVTIAVPFLLNQFHLPADLFHLFLLTGIVNGHVSSLAGAMHLFAFTAITAAVVTGRARFNRGRAVAAVAVTGLLIAVCIVTTRSYLGWMLSRSEDQGQVISGMQMITEPASATVLEEAGPNPRQLLDGQSRLDRIRETGVIRVGYFTENLPFSYVNERGMVVGLDVEMAHRLALDLGVTLELVPIHQPENMVRHLEEDHCDLIMSGFGAGATHYLELPFTHSYLELTPALVVPDHLRSEFDTMGELLDAKDVKFGVVNDPDVKRIVNQRIPSVEIVEIRRFADFFETVPSIADVLVISAEAGSAWTLLYPEYQVVVPFHQDIRWALAYPVAPGDPEFLRFLDLWVDLMRSEGVIARLHDHWILGRSAVPHSKRWSVIRNVLHWVD
jgi:proton glutamate symport protein